MLKGPLTLKCLKFKQNTVSAIDWNKTAFSDLLSRIIREFWLLVLENFPSRFLPPVFFKNVDFLLFTSPSRLHFWKLWFIASPSWFKKYREFNLWFQQILTKISGKLCNEHFGKKENLRLVETFSKIQCDQKIDGNISFLAVWLVIQPKFSVRVRPISQNFNFIIV